MVSIDIECPETCSDCPMLEGDCLDGFCHAASRSLNDEDFWIWYIVAGCDIDRSKPCNCPLVPVSPGIESLGNERKEG